MASLPRKQTGAILWEGGVRVPFLDDQKANRPYVIVNPFLIPLPSLAIERKKK